MSSSFLVYRCSSHLHGRFTFRVIPQKDRKASRGLSEARAPGYVDDALCGEWEWGVVL